MNDDVKDAVDELRAAILADRKRCGDDMAEALWKNEILILAHIDTFDARLAAAREEVRAAAAEFATPNRKDRSNEAAALREVAEDLMTSAFSVEATPLADRIAALEAEREALAGSLAYAADMTVEQVRATHEKAAIGIRTERDALRAQLLAERERMDLWLTAPDSKQYERGTVQDVFDELDTARAQQADADACIGALRANDDALRAQVAKLEADQHCPTCGSSVYTCVDCDVTPLRAQVEAARRFIEDDTCRHHEEKAEFLAAMDEAKP